MSDVAIAHGRFDSQGGAERVAADLARVFDAPIYAGYADQDVVPADVEVRELFTSRAAQLCDRLPHLFTDAYHMQAWQQRPELTEYDCVIVSKNNAGWYVPPDTQATVWYLHSTPRNLYDRFHAHRRGALKRYLHALQRTLYAPAVRTADALVANSDLVARRSERYWDREADAVVYPPVHTRALGPETAPTGEYYLSVGRLRRHKHTREIVDAATLADVPLKVAGKGPERAELEERAGSTVDVLGYVSEERKRKLLSGAKAFVFAGANEDFGIAPIEAMAAGTPVIGVADGFTQHQVREGLTGVLTEREPERLASVLETFDPEDLDWSEQGIAAWATKTFDRRRFGQSMAAIVDATIERSRVDPDWGRDGHRTVVSNP